ncbi:gamma-glutamyltransferase family protein [Pseudoclavibacter soli]|uniref:gamma-glutamyltransferase family protein n=1 Tax=Pseudoclavibacter soli TaxID=452623 RepID=UPI00040459D6
MPTFTTRPELTGDFGMVATTHWLASSVGMGVLERGGNAADAAVAAGFTLQVVEPHLNGPGGDAPIMIWDPAASDAAVICGQGTVPVAADIAAFTSLGLDVIPGSGLLAAVVPGAFGGWLSLLDRYGTWSLRDVLEPAIHYAEQGHPLLERAHQAIASVQRLFIDEWSTSAALWLHDGQVPLAGSRVRNARLAQTYRRILAEAEAGSSSRSAQIERARRAWYSGFVAEAVDAFCRIPARDSSGDRHRGLLTGDDLAGWRATVEPAISVKIAGTTFHKPGPWSQGPVMLQHLRLLEQTDVFDLEPGSEAWIHLVVEADKLALADREAWYGDPLSTDVPLTTLLSRAYAHERAKLIGSDASVQLQPGSPQGRQPRLPVQPVAEAEQMTAGTGEPTTASDGEVRGDTCHLDVVDAQGLMISATPSGGWLQSSPAIPQLGFALGTRAQMFWLQPGLASSLRPGRRPRTTLSPSLASRDGRGWMAFGTPGGDSQDQWSAQLALRALQGQPLQAAIDAVSFHTEHAPSSFAPRAARLGHLRIESRAAAEVIEGLRARGHRLEVGAP